MKLMDMLRRRRSSLGFTLMEVNSAIFIMAVGVLAMVSLYPLGYRESQQARDDVVAAAMADTVLGGLSSVLSSTNITWAAWEDFAKDCENSKGWSEYCDSHWKPKSAGSLSSTANGVIESVCRLVSGNNNTPSGSDIVAALNNLKNAASGQGDFSYALVATPGRSENGYLDRSRVVLSFRATRRAPMLFSQPVFSTEVHFQGQRRN